MLFGEMQTLRVLVIEDDALIALMLAEVLSDLGHVVCATAATPAEAITAAHKQRPNFLLSDVRLREGSGIDAVTEILREGQIPHMFMTGDLLGLHRRLPDAVAVRKPFSCATLAKAIAKALEAGAAS
jgi:two-component system, response regulator PdtaR